MLRRIIAFGVLISPVALAAQTAPASPPAPVISTDFIAREAQAKAVVDQIWPLGTYAKIMNGGAMNQIMDSIMQARMADMMPPDMAGPAGANGNKTLAQLSEEKDPHFRERMKITFDIMSSEMGAIMGKLEPDMRAILAKVYAKKFNTQQLVDMQAFFGSPSGKAYASESMLLMMDPDFMQGMQKMMPAMMQAMPGIMQKVQDATVHLPMPTPPKRPATPTRRPAPRKR